MYELDDGSWRLTEITNLKELLKEREQATAAKLKQLKQQGSRAELDARSYLRPPELSLSIPAAAGFPSYTMQKHVLP
ncbi:hypothetical protein [Phascolarctobacterium faecium]|uniref:hypothetical protein n=1 Tax=Phascolarctobacterium faecium TaxID=33025 RepID=UPI003521A726